MPLKKIIFIVGPTSVGKTPVSFVLAKKLKSEIISCDSMQVYREISIVNNKPPKEFLKKIPHRLVGDVSISKNYDVAAFQKRVLAAIRTVHRKNKVPIIAGGSGFYMKALLDGIFQKKAKDERLRRQLEEEAEKKGRAALYARLKAIDSVAASKIHPNDTRRIIRALEVFEITKKPISELQKTREGLWGRYDIKVFFLNRERGELYLRINRRVEEMFEDGLISEIRALAKKKWSKTAGAIIGLREVKGLLSGEFDITRATELMKQNTRRYAKRQLTWFRNDHRLMEITVSNKDTPEDVAKKILKRIKG